MSFANAFGNLFKIAELRKRLLFTLGLLAVYRVGVFVTAPGVNRVVMKKAIEATGGFLNLFNLFTGGALEQLSIFALGIMPYVSASIILQLLTVVVPALEKLLESGAIKDRKDGLKILGDGELTKAVSVKANKFSASAREKIEKAGGKVEEVVVVAKTTPQQRKQAEKKAAAAAKKA